LKKIITIVLFFIILLTFPSVAISRQSERPTLNDYSATLQNDLYPAIKKHIESFQFQPPSQEKAERLTEDVNDIIQELRNRGKLPSIFPPRITIVKLENELSVAFILEVKLELVDYEESIENVLITSIAFSKRFVILTLEKNNPDIEV